MTVPRETLPPDGAIDVFGDRLPIAVRYVNLLATAGVDRGLIGPREAPRLWDRHVLNCAVVVERIDQGLTVADVGSGAGLPGIVWAIARPDLKVVLIEPLLRRAKFLEECRADLGLTNVDLFRGRAAEVKMSYDVVTARAVAGLEKLSRWCLPLVRTGGVMLAFKGQNAITEVDAARNTLEKFGATTIVINTYGTMDIPTTVVEVTK